jgi:peroxiredoxin
VGLAYGACEDNTAATAKRITYVIGPDGVIQKAFPKVNAAAHPEEILQAL